VRPSMMAVFVGVVAAGCPTVPSPPNVGPPTVDTALALATADTAPACAECAWEVGEWLACSIPCGPAEGEQTRIVECVDGDGEPTDRTRCDPGEEPAGARPCRATGDCAWGVGDFGACSETCGDGVQTRVVRCEDPEGAPVDGAWCDAATRPAAEQACRDTQDCVWFESGFGSCDTTCGNGQQTQTVSCQGPGGGAVDPALCPGPQPANVQDCFVSSGCSWFTGSWSGCSVDCDYESGSQTRTVECRDPSGSAVSSSWCSPPAPDTTQTCSGTTPDSAWQTGPWGFCEEICIQSRTVSCPSGCCSAPQPAPFRPCSGGACFPCGGPSEPACP